MREIKFRMWGPGKYFYGEQAMECLFQQLTGLYDHCEGHGSVFEQYTGLRDKNGKEIYEGDIVNEWIDLGPGGEGQYIGVVEFGPLGCSMQPWTFKEDGYLPEVIGNIHQNPDLIGR